MNLNSLKPLGLHVTGVIRFGAENRGTEEFRQLDHFEVLGRSYEQPQFDGDLPNLKPHAINAKLQAGEGGAAVKLRSIPVKVIFNEPANALTARYEAFDPDLNRLACVGDGEQCSRANFESGTVMNHPCVGPDACAHANSTGLACQLRVRLTVQIDGQDDPLAAFEVQSGGIHTYRTLAAKLEAVHAVTGGKLRGVPMNLVMYERGSPAHDFKPFYVADLVLRNGSLEQAKQDADAQATAPDEALFAKLEARVQAMRESSPFASSDDDSDCGVIYAPAAPLPARRVQRTQRKAAADASAIVSAQSVNDVIARAKNATADKPASQPQEQPSLLQGIQLPAGCAMSTSAQTAPAASPATAETVELTATINGREETAPVL